jgi:hypothetical protein
MGGVVQVGDGMCEHEDAEAQRGEEREGDNEWGKTNKGGGRQEAARDERAEDGCAHALGAAAELRFHVQAETR